MKTPGTGIVTLQRRSEFLRVRNGLRWSTATFVLEAKSREGWVSPTPLPSDLARFGFTVTKKLGSAVQRNRIKRRLRAALQVTVPKLAKPGYDYVIIARQDAETCPFDGLVANFVTAFEKAHSKGPQASVRNRTPKVLNSSQP
jgi:ribonuclease P protein component